jgi:hypothetical protein
MDKGAKDKLAESPGENGEQDAQKRLSLKNWKGRDEEEDPGKDGIKSRKRKIEVLFDRPKPTADCSANGRRRRR